MLHILFATDDAYAMPMAVAAHSALVRLTPDTSVDLTVVDTGLSSDSLRRIRAVLTRAHPKTRITFRRPDVSLVSGINVRHYSTASLGRLMMPDFFAEDVDRVLYLDSDIVVDGNVEELWEMDLGETAIWAVQNGPDSEFDTALRDRIPGLEAPEDARYFNSGVLLVNLPQWRAQRISERALDYLRAHSHELSFPDQDTLNVIAAEGWGRLPPRWNKQVIRLGEPDTAPLSAPGVLHYTSHKPWQPVFPWKGKLAFQKAYLRSGWDRFDRAALRAARLLLAQYAHHTRVRLSRRLPSLERK